MASDGDAVVALAGEGAGAQVVGRPRQRAARRISMEGLQRAVSELALELARDSKKAVADAAAWLPAVAEEQADEARCECCGMVEECTSEYVRRVRERYCGRWVCGLCATAVSAEADRSHHGSGGGRTTTTEEALAAHMAVCGRFNRVGRANPVLMQTEAMREILRKRGKSNSPRDSFAHGDRLTRSSSCIPAITKDLSCIKK